MATDEEKIESAHAAQEARHEPHKEHAHHRKEINVQTLEEEAVTDAHEHYIPLSLYHDPPAA